MGFDCIVCGEREIWAFESVEPRVCEDCYKRKNGKERKLSDNECGFICLKKEIEETPGKK